MADLPSKTFCVLPWMHVSTQPNGPIVLCCESKFTHGMNQARNIIVENHIPRNNFLYLGENSIEEMVNSDFYRGVRTAMLNGGVPEACKPCFDKEAKGFKSKRLRENKRYGHLVPKLLENTNEDRSLKRPDLTFLELRLGNVCNVRCRTCNPNSSSQWGKDYNKLTESKKFLEADYNNIPGSYDWAESDLFWKGIIDNAETIEELYINGGEPTLIKSHWKALNKLVKSGHARHIDLWYSTNMTRMPEDQIQIWKEFRSIRVQASIDDLEDRNHYIRYPTEWTDVLESIDILKRNEISWGIIQTISVMNIYHLPEFLKWATSMGADVVHNFVFNPYYLSPAALSAATKEKIYTRLEKEMPEEYMGNIAGVLKAFENSATEEFRVFTKEMDEIRGQSFKKTFPELNELLQVEGVEMS